MPRLQVIVSEELMEAIANQAKSERSTVSQVSRRALWDYFMPDQATLERCATLVDAREPYTTGGDGEV